MKFLVENDKKFFPRKIIKILKIITNIYYMDGMTSLK